MAQRRSFDQIDAGMDVGPSKRTCTTSGHAELPWTQVADFFIYAYSKMGPHESIELSLNDPEYAVISFTRDKPAGITLIVGETETPITSREQLVALMPRVVLEQTFQVILAIIKERFGETTKAYMGTFAELLVVHLASYEDTSGFGTLADFIVEYSGKNYMYDSIPVWEKPQKITPFIAKIIRAILMELLVGIDLAKVEMPDPKDLY